MLWTVGAFVACILMLWGASRIEPHWVSKDGGRFLTTCVPIDRLGKVIGRRREIRGAFLDNGSLMLSQRHFLRQAHTEWQIEAKAPAPRSAKVVYVLRPVVPAVDGSKLLLRVPAKSEIIPALDARSPTTAIHDLFDDPDDPDDADDPDDDPGDDPDEDDDLGEGDGERQR